MNRAQHAVNALLAFAALVLVGWRTLVWRSAAAEFRLALAFRTEIDDKSARLAALRVQPPVSGFGSRPADDVLQLANRVLESAGLATARMRGVQPESDRALADDRDGRRATTVRLGIEPVTTQELGALLVAWRNTQQVWSVSRIELSAIPPTREAGNTRVAGHYRASITVMATYIDDTISTSPPLLGAAQ